VTTTSLANGLTLLGLEQGRTPLVEVALLFRSGRADAEPGVAELTAASLEAAAGGGSTEATWQRELEMLGSSLQVDVNHEATRFALRVRSQDVAGAMALLARAVTSQLAAATFSRTKAHLVATRKRHLAADPEQTVRRLLLERLFASEDGRSGYARDVASADELAAVSHAHCAAFQREHYTPPNAALLVAGAVRAEVAAQTARDTFGNWKGPAPTARKPRIPAARRGLRLLAVDFPDLPQSLITLGARGPRAHAENWSAFRTAIQVLRGRSETGALRELVGVGSLSRPRIDIFERATAPSILLLSAWSRQRSLTENARAMLEELHRLGREPPAPLELLGAQRRTAAESIMENDTLRGAVRKLTELGRFQLPATHHDDAWARLSDLGPEAVRTAALTLEVESVVLVVAGPAKETTIALGALGPATKVVP
jgi:zinc protease